jgi:thioredoxin reductase (NADPH)
MIVGGGNSAGQAAVFLSQKSTRVHLLIRGGELKKSMSSYLVNRIVNDPKIEIHTHTEVKELLGEDWLERIILENNLTYERQEYTISDLFLFLGAIPCSKWLEDVTFLDKNGFVYTGRDIPKEALNTYHWANKYPPQSLETCMPGLFAVGDVRYGSVKRVASAVGEGSMAVSQIHAFLSKGA